MVPEGVRVDHGREHSSRHGSRNRKLFTSLNINVKKEQTENEIRLLTSEPAPSDVLPAKLHHLNLPKEYLQLGTKCSSAQYYGRHFSFKPP